MRNAGIGLFNEGIEFPVGENPDCPEMLAVDLDDDGDVDLATFNEGSNDVSVLENRVRVRQEDLGFGGPGSAKLSIVGEPFATGKSADLRVTGAAANRPAFLVASLTASPTPFKGGFLVPIGLEIIVPLVTDGAGEIALLDLGGGGGPLDVFLQALILDPAQTRGFAITNAVRLEVLP
jgi:hypothetical protein